MAAAYKSGNGPVNVRFGSSADIRSKDAMSALPPKADINGCIFDVRFVPKAEMSWLVSAKLPHL
jgi:hypothetical protein